MSLGEGPPSEGLRLTAEPLLLLGHVRVYKTPFLIISMGWGAQRRAFCGKDSVCDIPLDAKLLL